MPLQEIPNREVCRRSDRGGGRARDNKQLGIPESR